MPEQITHQFGMFGFTPAKIRIMGPEDRKHYSSLLREGKAKMKRGDSKGAAEDVREFREFLESFERRLNGEIKQRVKAHSAADAGRSCNGGAGGQRQIGVCRCAGDRGIGQGCDSENVLGIGCGEHGPAPGATTAVLTRPVNQTPNFFKLFKWLRLRYSD